MDGRRDTRPGYFPGVIALRQGNTHQRLVWPVLYSRHRGARSMSVEEKFEELFAEELLKFAEIFGMTYFEFKDKLQAGLIHRDIHQKAYKYWENAFDARIAEDKKNKESVYYKIRSSREKNDITLLPDIKPKHDNRQLKLNFFDNMHYNISYAHLNRTFSFNARLMDKLARAFTMTDRVFLDYLDTLPVDPKTGMSTLKIRNFMGRFHITDVRKARMQVWDYFDILRSFTMWEGTMSSSNQQGKMIFFDEISRDKDLNTYYFKFTTFYREVLAPSFIIMTRGYLEKPRGQRHDKVSRLIFYICSRFNSQVNLNTLRKRTIYFEMLDILNFLNINPVPRSRHFRDKVSDRVLAIILQTKEIFAQDCEEISITAADKSLVDDVSMDSFLSESSAFLNGYVKCVITKGYLQAIKDKQK